MLLLLLFLCPPSPSSAAVVVVVPRGRAAWFYDPSGSSTPAVWAPAVAAFNNGSSFPIEIAYVYGGDMEYYPHSANPYQTYFPAANQEAALIYSQTLGVKTVILTVDGSMNGGQSYDPDLSKLNTSAVQQWADVTAALYCNFSQVGGIQIDLEPFVAPYITNTLVYLTRLSANLRSAQFNCVNARYPEGRLLAAFLPANSANAAVYQALGPLGFVVISGYDLSSKAAGVASTPAAYGTALRACIQQALNGASNSSGKFSLGIPASATAHEFLQYKKANGAVVKGHPNWSNTTASYLTTAFQVIQQMNLTSSAQYNSSFLGVSLWGFNEVVAIPVGSRNIYSPANPFTTPGELAWLESH